MNFKSNPDYNHQLNESLMLYMIYIIVYIALH